VAQACTACAGYTTYFLLQLLITECLIIYLHSSIFLPGSYQLLPSHNLSFFCAGLERVNKNKRNCRVCRHDLLINPFSPRESEFFGKSELKILKVLSHAARHPHRIRHFLENQVWASNSAPFLSYPYLSTVYFNKQRTMVVHSHYVCYPPSELICHRTCWTGLWEWKG